MTDSIHIRPKPVTDTQVAARFPAEWARANDPALPNRSKARQKLRQRYRIAIATDAWRTANPGAFCSNCAHCSHPALRPEAFRCDLESDFHGDAIVRDPQTEWCARWSPPPTDNGGE